MWSRTHVHTAERMWPHVAQTASECGLQCVHTLPCNWICRDGCIVSTPALPDTSRTQQADASKRCDEVQQKPLDFHWEFIYLSRQERLQDWWNEWMDSLALGEMRSVRTSEENMTNGKIQISCLWLFQTQNGQTPRCLAPKWRNGLFSTGGGNKTNVVRFTRVSGSLTSLPPLLIHLLCTVLPRQWLLTLVMSFKPPRI